MILYQLLRGRLWLHAWPIRKWRERILELAVVIDLAMMLAGTVYFISFFWHMAGAR